MKTMLWWLDKNYNKSKNLKKKERATAVHSTS